MSNEYERLPVRGQRLLTGLYNWRSPKDGIVHVYRQFVITEATAMGFDGYTICGVYLTEHQASPLIKDAATCVVCLANEANYT